MRGGEDAVEEGGEVGGGTGRVTGWTVDFEEGEEVVDKEPSVWLTVSSVYDVVDPFLRPKRVVVEGREVGSERLYSKVV